MRWFVCSKLNSGNKKQTCTFRLFARHLRQRPTVIYINFITYILVLFIVSFSVTDCDYYGIKSITKRMLPDCQTVINDLLILTFHQWLLPASSEANVVLFPLQWYVCNVYKYKVSSLKTPTTIADDTLRSRILDYVLILPKTLLVIGVAVKAYDFAANNIDKCILSNGWNIECLILL